MKRYGIVGGVVVVAIAVAVVAGKKRRRKERRGKKESAKMSMEEREKADEMRALKKAKSGAMVTLYKLLLPRKLLGGGEESRGVAELGCMVVLCLIRIVLMNATSNLVGELDRVMMTRNQRHFWRAWWASLGLTVATSLHRQTYKYVENSLGVQWREKLTAILSRMYFRNMNYYALSQGASGMSGSTIADPAERITSDVKEVTEQMSLVLCEGLYTLTTGGFFAYKLGRLYGLRFALAPYAYLWSAIVITTVAVPMNWGRLFGNVKKLFSSFRESLDRVQIHHEAIRALGGNAFEAGAVRRTFDDWLGAVKSLNVKLLRSGFADQLAFHWWLRTFVSFIVIGPHIMWPRRKRNLNSIEDLAALRGAIGHQFVLFVQSMISAGVSAKMVRQVQQLSGSAARLGELLFRLRGEEDRRAAQSESALQDGDCIEFRNVRVETPAGNLLVKDLSFRLERGESLLITGFNGAGKSSIFRMLGQLWEVREGTIVKPGHESGLHNDVFYLPQKPYNVLGTLRDQILYPGRAADHPAVGRDEVTELLRLVRLEHLVQYPGAWTDDLDWSRILSLGEQQRLAIARLCFHQPAYVILDEATSGCALSTERALYMLCLRRNITYITISHRPLMQQYHHQVLTIGLPGAAYRLERLSPPQLGEDSELAQAAATLATREAAAVDGPPNATDASRPAARGGRPGVLHRLVTLLRHALGRSDVIRLVAFVAGSLLQARLHLAHAVNGSDMMGCIFSLKSASEKTRDFLRLCAHSTALSLLLAGVEQATLKLKRDLEVSVIQNLTSDLLDKYLRNSNFYNLTQRSGVSDGPQRISTDVKDFARRLTALLPLTTPVIEMFWFATRIHTLVGTWATASFGAYLIGGGLLIRSALPDFSKLVAEESELEAKYSAVHSRVQTFAESIAFLGGGPSEANVVKGRFDDLMRIMWLRLQKSWKFGLINQQIVREAPMLLQWLLRNEYGKNWGTDEELCRDGGQELNRAQVFLFGATNTMFEAMGQILGMGEQLSQLYGLVDRIYDFDRACLDSEASSAASTAITTHSEHSIMCDDIDIVTPAGKRLATGVSLAVTPERPLMVTGPNASGKTSFFRVLGGLWDTPRGKIAVPSSEKRPGIFLVPQKVYMVASTLAHQITYPSIPKQRSPQEEEHLGEILELVGLSYLLDREGGWDATRRWEDVLSLGEQQRLGMARLFYHKPVFGIIDASTDAVSVDMEQTLYRAARQFGITCLTMSQRLCLEDFHSQELRMGDISQSGHVVAQLDELEK
mmetsp:Transcript_17915/g.50472  ORF Transcript_17915/g.50472 Transcript_17915/m.50472 type:complete len:1265 (+) Transcript_17915:174-3968(+)